ncbi:hypothetical protein D9611_013338 [Ephemerocybe angulata]|uniref:C2H2-type domain-containing protein n=1 Tax=Ephemerocybe angulata TaxID=980116 RepID=A0A8H5CCW0_9AGAR|nr:hypothetical protein D9611_013338 [Tulosesus angulatus]
MRSLKEQLRSFQCPDCRKLCTSSRGLKQHQRTAHPVLSSDDSENDEEVRQHTTLLHPLLNGVPVDKDGHPLPAHTKPPSWNLLDSENAYSPFEDRLSFDFAQYHFVEVQSSAGKINKALDLWLAAKVQAIQGTDCDDLPWASADELYATIDEIQQGVAPFRTVHLKYSGPLPEGEVPPEWMTATYELCVRDARQVIHHQLGTPAFATQFRTAPYKQFDRDGNRVWSDLLSGDWAWREADKIASEVPGSKGAMLVPVVAGLDKTTVSVATGHQEYHPFYLSKGNLTNVARRGHEDGVVPSAFLPIPKVSKTEKKKKIYQQFARQLYHACIALIYEPLRAGMSSPEIVRCPDGHFRRAVYSIGPVIADYPEQVWLSGIVQGWCPKCRARPDNLDDPNAPRRTHEQTDTLIDTYDPGILWDEYGIREDIVPFTHSFPRADIHELMAPDLLHQVIKGTFKDHLVEWVMLYLRNLHGEAKAAEIIADIDRRISSVPPFPGLRRFEDGRDFAQWTGDDSKALMKVYLSAIVGYVPPGMVQCLAAFLEVCYIFRRNAITSNALKLAETQLAKFHELRKIFVETGTRSHCSLPRQHALLHFIPSIIDFGAPNGLCSSITESRHISAVKETWRRSSRYNALSQMLVTIVRLDKMSALERILAKNGFLEGSTAMGMARSFLLGDASISEVELDDENDVDEECEDTADIGPEDTPRMATSVKLSATTISRYPRRLHDISDYLREPQFTTAFLEYLFTSRHPNREIPPDFVDTTRFSSKIYVHHSATARFYAPSDICGAGGMQRQIIRCNPNYRGHQRFDTVFVSMGDASIGIKGMMVAQLQLLFSFTDPYNQETHSCALVNWFNTVGNEVHPLTGMWVVEREEVDDERPLQVINLSTIVRGAHFLPVFGEDEGRLPEGFQYTDALEAFERYFVNPYIDHHAHEMLSI